MPKPDLLTVHLTRRELESLPMQLRRRISRRWKAHLRAQADYEVFRDAAAAIRCFVQKAVTRN